MKRLLQCAALLASGAAAAQATRSEFVLDGKVTATDNGAAAAEGAERSDLLTSLRPSWRVARRAPGLQLNADLSADFIDSARGTQRDRVLPDARVAADATLVERLLFLQTSVDVRQVEENVLGPQQVAGFTQNLRTAGILRVSPYVATDLSSRVKLSARLDETWARFKGTLAGDGQTQRVSLKVEGEPRPLGWIVEGAREATSFKDPLATDFAIDRLRVTGTAAVWDDWVLGVAAGRERADFEGRRQSDQTWGWRAFWVPGPRTELALAMDERFFGLGWNLTARHRTPRMSFAVRALREPTDAGTMGRGDGLTAMLDAILTTRNPDPAQRAGLVDALIATRGLPDRLQGPTGAAAAYVQLRNAADVTWVYLTPRTAVSLNAFGEKRLRLEPNDGAPAALGDDDSWQAGLSVDWNYRLTPESSLDVGAGYSRTSGLGTREGERTKQGSLRVIWIANLSPRLKATVGTSVRRLRTNASGTNSFDQAAAIAGLAFKF